MPELTIPRGKGVFIPLVGAPRLELPLGAVKVSAGFPSPAADYEDKRLDINEYGYHKAGITLMNIVPAKSQQLSLFVSGGADDARSQRLMDVLDGINGKYGRGTMHLAAEGLAKGWQMRRGNLSPLYTTDWGGLAVVQAR